MLPSTFYRKFNFLQNCPYTDFFRLVVVYFPISIQSLCFLAQIVRIRFSCLFLLNWWFCYRIIQFRSHLKIIPGYEGMIIHYWKNGCPRPQLKRYKQTVRCSVLILSRSVFSCLFYSLQLPVFLKLEIFKAIKKSWLEKALYTFIVCQYRRRVILMNNRWCIVRN